MRIVNIIKNPKKILIKLDNLGLIKINDETYIKMYYEVFMKKKLDLNNPITFNEKIQYLKLYDRKEYYSKLVDKYEVKEYISKIIGEKYIIPTIDVYDNFNEINFDKLPQQFVIKCTHDSGGIVICKSKSQFDINKAKKKINKSLNRNFYKLGREWPYKNVKPRIIIEKYLEDSIEKKLRDYKFFCFNGEMKVFKIDFDRFDNHGANYYNKDLELITLGEKVCPPNFNKKLTIPKNINEMVKLAEKIAKGMPFVRVDFYDIDNSIYFGEITFYPASGIGKFLDEKWDYTLGNWIRLPERD